jgi:predicted AlkP superfamily phosphohydrolase/phosphomutase
MADRRRVLMLGIDSAPPELLFDELRPELPVLSNLFEHGLWGPLESSIPAITVPAWMTAMTSKDPGQLGIYGFRNRADHSYDKLAMATSQVVREDTVWDILGRAGRASVVCAVPPAFPPKSIHGSMIGCFLTPSDRSQYTYPASLRDEIGRLVGEYLVDVMNFRSEDKEHIRRSCHEMTEKRFTVIRHLMQNRDWDFFGAVEIGSDRMQHGLWRYHDRSHPHHDPESPFRWAIRDYYSMIDDQIGSVLELAGDDTAVMIVSDHGAKTAVGFVCVNDWLIREGLLAVESAPSEATPFSKVGVDWSKTVAWGEGGYYARIFMNVRGREPEGIVAPEDYEKVRDELAERLRSIPGPDGAPLDTNVYKPEEIYRAVNNVAPDLIVYFGDLDWRSNGYVGHGSIHTTENDIGPDDANHGQFGVFGLHDGTSRGANVQNLKLLDVGPTILDLLEHPIPEDMQGRAISRPTPRPPP